MKILKVDVVTDILSELHKANEDGRRIYYRLIDVCCCILDPIDNKKDFYMKTELSLFIRLYNEYLYKIND